jgi:NAD-dependent deacetylase
MMDPAIDIASRADILVVVGTSLQVYPAASLVQYVPRNCPIYVVDPGASAFSGSLKARFIAEPATTGLATLEEIIFNEG